jgi:hypothetical protein
LREWNNHSKIELGIKFPTGLGVEVYELFRHDDSPAEQFDLFERFKTELSQNVFAALETTYKAYKR